MTATAKKIKNEESSNQEVSNDSSFFPSRHEIIAELAYLKAEKRGFLPGYEISDWFEAEKELGI